jgi:hypothetical protein
MNAIAQRFAAIAAEIATLEAKVLGGLNDRELYEVAQAADTLQHHMPRGRGAKECRTSEALYARCSALYVAYQREMARRYPDGGCALHLASIGL